MGHRQRSFEDNAFVVLLIVVSLAVGLVPLDDPLEQLEAAGLLAVGESLAGVTVPKHEELLRHQDEQDLNQLLGIDENRVQP